MLIMVTSGEGYAVENMKELSLFMSKPLYFFLISMRKQPFCHYESNYNFSMPLISCCFIFSIIQY